MKALYKAATAKLCRRDVELCLLRHGPSPRFLVYLFI